MHPMEEDDDDEERPAVVIVREDDAPPMPPSRPRYATSTRDAGRRSKTTLVSWCATTAADAGRRRGSTDAMNDGRAIAHRIAAEVVVR